MTRGIFKNDLYPRYYCFWIISSFSDLILERFNKNIWKFEVSLEWKITLWESKGNWINHSYQETINDDILMKSSNLLNKWTKYKIKILTLTINY